VYQILDGKSDAETAQRQTAELQARYTEVTRTFPAAPTTAENLQRAVEISQKIGAFTRSPELMTDLISQALERNPAIILKSLGWKYGTSEIDPEAGKSAKPASDAGAPAVAGTARRQSGIVEGEVRPFRGDYRAAIDAINRFADSLSELPQVNEVRVVKLPLNISPDLSLSGNTTDSREQAGKAEFKLMLTLKPTI
jgi:hypothetical protein